MRRGLGEPFVISGQAVEAGCPGLAAFHHPAARQQDESAFSLGMFDHFQPHAMLVRRLGRVFSGVALIDIRQLDVLTRHLLHRFEQRFHLCAVLLISCGNVQGQQMVLVQKCVGNAEMPEEEQGLCGKNCIPDRWNSSAPETKTPKGELYFANTAEQFDSSDNGCCVIKVFEAKHRSTVAIGAVFDTPLQYRPG